MKIPAARLDAFCRRPDPGLRAVLVYGPDQGQVRERAQDVARAVVPDLHDPFRVAEIAARDLQAAPGRLIEEAAAMAFSGGRRLVRVREAGDRLTEAFKSALAADTGDSLILVEAGDLSARSSLRKLFEGHDAAAAAPCYVEEGAGVGRFLRDALAAEGVIASPEAIDFLTANLAGDRMVLRREVEKLTLYAGETKRIDLDDAVACAGDAAAMTFDDLVLAAADGDFVATDRALARLLADGEEPVGILRVAQRHFLRLYGAAAEIDAGERLDAVVDGMRPPLFFKVKPRFKSQLQRWSPARLQAALDALVQAEADCKRTGLPAATICGRAFLRVASLARAGRRERAS